MNEVPVETEKRIRKAMQEDDLDYIRDFFENNPDLFAMESPIGTWLYIAVEYGKEDIIQYFISQGADINYGGKKQETPLSFAVGIGRINIVKLLLDQGARIDTDDILENPLFIAIQRRNPEMVSFLLKQGIDLTVKYQLSYGEVDALIFAECWSTPEVVALIADQYAALGISIPKLGKKQEKPKGKSHSRKKIDKRILKDKLDFAVRQMVREVRNKLENKGEELYAMCFRMHSDEEDAEWRYLCEVITQTVKGYEKGMKEYEVSLKKSGEEYDASQLLAFKYIPEEYQYTENGLDGFQKVQEYLRDNCLDLDECDVIEDADEEERMYDKIQEQNWEIEKILADVVAKLRKEKFLSFYVFPYIGEDDLPEDIILLAKRMNKGLELTEYIEFLER